MTTDRPPPRRRRRTHQGEETASLRKRSGATSGRGKENSRKLTDGDNNASFPTDKNPFVIRPRCVPRPDHGPTNGMSDDRARE